MVKGYLAFTTEIKISLNIPLHEKNGYKKFHEILKTFSI